MKKLLAAALCLTIATSALAQSPAAPTSSAPASGDIVVEARRRDAVKAYVQRLTRPGSTRQVARWGRNLCIKYKGMDERFAGVIHARITDLARHTDLRVERENCPATTLIQLDDDADGVARALVHYGRPTFGSVTDQTPRARDEIAAIEQPRTIRWLTTSETINQDGAIPDYTGAGAGGSPVSNRLWRSSLIRDATREEVRSKIILIDAARLKGVTLRQFADYLAFITMTMPDIAADYSGTDSIMALFADTPDPSARLSNQDTTFVQALYAIPPHRSADAQRAALLTRMLRPARE